MRIQVGFYASATDVLRVATQGPLGFVGRNLVVGSGKPVLSANALVDQPWTLQQGLGLPGDWVGRTIRSVEITSATPMLFAAEGGEGGGLALHQTREVLVNGDALWVTTSDGPIRIGKMDLVRGGFTSRSGSLVTGSLKVMGESSLGPTVDLAVAS